MSAALERALAREAEAGRERAEAEAEALVARVGTRLRRRRMLTLGGGAVAGVAAIALVASVLGGAGRTADPGAADGDAPASATTVTRTTEPSQARSEAGAAAYGDILLANARPRTRGQEVGEPGQEALLCPDTQENEMLAPCDALWVGDGSVIAIDPAQTRVWATEGKDSAVVQVDWRITNKTATPLTLELADTTVALLADPDAAPGRMSTLDLGTFAGTSLWATDATRIAHNSPMISAISLGAGEGFGQSATFTATRPGTGTGADADPLWDIVTGAAGATLTVQVGLIHTADGSGLILEASAPVELGRTVSADELAATWMPRAIGDEAPEDKQAALLCDVPESAEGWQDGEADVPNEGIELGCDAGWVDGPVLAATDGALTTGADIAAVSWGLETAGSSTVRVEGLRAVLEAEPESIGTARWPLVATEDAVATLSSAWRDDRSRSAWLGGGFSWNTTLFPDLMIGTSSTVRSNVDTVAQGLNLPALTRALASGEGSATVQATMAFVDDPTRVLILEVPVELGAG
ncbi:hypothetical protein [Demequina soli]|uniref:hypothetical protein n=1 Tax=Demequina soli TaxID=1638987 RepID=UPI000785087B|nr:hypothetical protein [Demequina soli]